MDFGLRPATLEDARLVADLQTAVTPDDPHDADMVAYWWTHEPEARHALRLLGRDIYFSARRGDWVASARRYGMVHLAIHPRVWTAEVFAAGLDAAESWLRAEEAQVAVARIMANVEREVRALLGRGYQQVREQRLWELDLQANRDVLLEAAQRSRGEMRAQGVELLTLAEEGSDRTLQHTYELDVVSTSDIPTTVPHAPPRFDEWRRNYFENPGIRKDRFWIARLGDEVVGMSLIEYPPVRGIPSTEYTGVLPRFRGRGIARALKYETIAQAIALGGTRVRTDNDSQNAPILRINAAMGYAPMTPIIELHRDL